MAIVKSKLLKQLSDNYPNFLKKDLEKYGTEGSGKNLPFSSLSEDLKKKDEEK